MNSGIGTGYSCQMCGGWVSYNAPHTCQWTVPGIVPNYQQPLQPMGPPCRAPYMPLTLEDIRKVIREELDRKPSDSAGEQS